MILINLFSIFDPSTSISFSINWISVVYIFIFIPLIYWFIPSRIRIIFNLLISYLFKEFKILLGKKINVINLLIFIRIFIFILLNNVIGMFMYIFTSTRHLVVRISISLILWISIIIFGWLNYSNYIFIHLVPSGTPIILIPFIVLIETVRNLIRPLTLAVRLSANIISGHLLMTLISSTGRNLNNLFLRTILFGQIILIILEFSVAIIQAYVFTILRTLYIAESNYGKMFSTLSFSYIKSLTYFNFFKNLYNYNWGNKLI